LLRAYLPKKDHRNGSLYKTILNPFRPIEDVNIPGGEKGRKGRYLMSLLSLLTTAGVMPHIHKEKAKMRLKGRAAASLSLELL